MVRVGQTDPRRAHRVSSIGLALVAHTGFSLFGVLVKRLLCCLPPFRLLAVAFGVAALIIFLVVSRGLSRRVSFTGRSEVWLLLATAALRSTFRVLALRFTLATYVQLIGLTVPLLTPIAAWVWLRETIPPRTVIALAATSLGSFLMIAVDPFDIQLPNGSADLVGIALALASSVAMALYIVCTRHLMQRETDSTVLFLQQAIALALTHSVLSALGGEGWEPFTSLTPSDWAIYALLILVAIVGGGLTQVAALSRVKATLYSTLLSWRLAVALGAGWLLLGERLVSAWQIIGVGIVISAVTLYLRFATRQGDRG